MKAGFLGIILFVSLFSCAQNKSDRAVLGLSNAESELTSSLKDKSLHNVINSKTTLVKDSITAINIAEPILFSVYGKDNIIKQQPYDIYHIKKHWILSGTLPKGNLGGNFLIIIDDLVVK